MTARDEAKKIVAEWFLEFWVDRPGWLVRIPSADYTQSLVERIARALATAQTASQRGDE